MLPVQLLYDDGYEGIVAGFVWQHFVMIDTLARCLLIYLLENSVPLVTIGALQQGDCFIQSQ